ncbi:MAG: 2-oxo acid dehydrogenase subunit E2 [Clostridia bacterium]|nr:2-oxo acid dehydrogenase subunit E2 [Clostridia bacterium]MDD4375586.1 2-oxo acid dehydrogenase subunit E2 [Clostridia bacterium]
MFNKRYDGRRIKKLDAFHKIIPYIMKTRVDSQVFFEEKIYVDNISKYIQDKRKQGIRISTMEVVIAAVARMMHERPGVNRFIMNRRIYARNMTWVSLAIKKTLADEAVETTVKFEIKPQDSIFDVSKQINDVIVENKKETTKNNTDKLANFIMSFPNVIIKALVELIMWMDKHNILPKSVIKASPFHTSVFITNVGSIGIAPIYHHIYEFGTTSIFVAMGRREFEKLGDGTIKKFMRLKVVADERICDGLYYARSLSVLNKYMQNPHLLEIPMEKAVEDLQ